MLPQIYIDKPPIFDAESPAIHDKIGAGMLMRIY